MIVFVCIIFGHFYGYIFKYEHNIKFNNRFQDLALIPREHIKNKPGIMYL